jgi:hypothetical protein
MVEQREGRHFRINAKILWEVAQLTAELLRMLADIPAIKEYLSAVRQLQSSQCAH